MQMISCLRLAVAAMAWASLSACTVVRVSDGGQVHTTYYPGVAVVRIARGDSVQMIDVQTLGGGISGNQLNLGWSHSRVAQVPPGRCQFIAWETTAERLADLRGLLGEATELCDSKGEIR